MPFLLLMVKTFSNETRPFFTIGRKKEARDDVIKDGLSCGSTCSTRRGTASIYRVNSTRLLLCFPLEKFLDRFVDVFLPTDDVSLCR